MRKLLTMLSGLALAGVMVTAALSAPTDKPAAPASAANKSIGDLRQEIVNVLGEREDALRQLNENYAAAPLDQRTALEAQMAQVQMDYERHYLELLVDYHRLSGNAEELARAERMLGNLNAGAVTGTQLDLPRNLQPTQATPVPRAGQNPEVRHDR